MSKLKRWMTACGVFLLGAAMPIASFGQTTAVAPTVTFTTLYSFCAQVGCTDGGNPYAALVQATNGNLYGTTAGGGGASSFGTVFKISPSGALSTLYRFCTQSDCLANGILPLAGLVQATNGNLYGTASQGGANGAANGDGTVFKITPGGTLTTLYSFCSQSDCADGNYPSAVLVQATNGNIYGTTEYGGTNNEGVVFKITPGGTLMTLHSFDGTDGRFPEAGLAQGTDGNFYGTTGEGGASDAGTVFKITLGGTLTTLYSFCSQANCADGSLPIAGLVQATDGNFYGTTYGGGASGEGTVFKITPGGTLTTLHSFEGTDGQTPMAGLVQGTDGNFYGTTSQGGANAGGTIFKINPRRTLTTLYNFCSQNNCADGIAPYATLVQDTNGTFYGTTYGGGANASGTVFSLSVGLGPFVITQTTSGAEGAAVNILGTSLTHATSVAFGGIAATFTVVSPSEITTTVPAGALTGPVKVTVGATTLTSAQTFRVTPTITSFSPPSGPVGMPVTIAGRGLTQTSKVTFNKTVATFTVNSDTQVTATVPTGATTGKIVITTPGGTATSSTSFTVN